MDSMPRKSLRNLGKYLRLIYKLIIRESVGSEPSFRDLMAKGESYQSGRKYGKALKLYESLMNENQNNILLLYNLAFCNYMKGKSEKALMYWDQVLQRATIDFIENHNIYAMKSKDLITLGRLEDALKLVDNYLPEYPSDTLLLLFKCEALLGLQRFAQSLKTSFTCIENADIQNDEEVLGWALLWQGQAFRNLNMCEQAQDAYAQALDIDSSVILANVFEAEICYMSDDYGQALVSLEFAMKEMQDPRKIQNYTRADIKMWKKAIQNISSAISSIQEVYQLAVRCEFKNEAKTVYDKTKNEIDLFIYNQFQIFLPSCNPNSHSDVTKATGRLKAYQLQLGTLLEGLRIESIVCWEDNIFNDDNSNEWDKLKGYTSGAFDYAKYFYWLLSNFTIGYRISTCKYIDEGQMKVAMIRIANEVSDYTMHLFGYLPSIGDFIQDIMAAYEKVFSSQKKNQDLQYIFNQLFLLDDQQNQKQTNQICEPILASSLEIGKYLHSQIGQSKSLKWHSHKKPKKIFSQVWQFFQEQVIEVERKTESLELGLFKCQASKAALRDMILLISFLHKYFGEVLTSNKEIGLPTIICEVIAKELILKPLEDVDIKQVCDLSDLNNRFVDLEGLPKSEYKDPNCCRIF